MPKKKPYSGKQKKKQMQEKKLRKCDDSDEDEDERHRRGKHPKPKINPEVNNVDRKQDPHRYRLQFYKESNDVIKQRKLDSMLPFTKLPEKSLEVDMDILYKPGYSPEIPKRPTWDYKLSKQKLEIKEDKVFKEYVDSLFEDYNVADLSYFELNLETWRQLWRVLEMSDILLLISDIRHPMLNFSPALYHHVIEDLNKPLILVLNKVDLALPGLVIAWREYLIQKFPKLHIVCFSSFQRFETTEGTAQGAKVFKTKKHMKYDAVGPRELWQACEGIVQGKVDLTEWRNKIEEDLSDAMVAESDAETITEKSDYSFIQHELYKDGILTIGCIGYPNVGKSSLINGLMGKKVVSVSKTPGHTKHFQTIFLTPTVKLCDCPGLVFPSLVEKSLQILAGIYPIAQVRDPFTPIGYLAQRVDVTSLLRLIHPESERHEEASPLEWSAVDISEAWAEKRRFYTSKAARPDISRAANHLLRFTVDGRIRLCFRPLGYTEKQDEWSQHPDALKLLARSIPKDSSSDSESEDDSQQVSAASDNEMNDGGSEEVSGEEEEEDDVGISLSNPFSILG